MADIIVNLISETGSVTRAGFGKPLILANTQHDFKNYASLTELSNDFTSDTTVYKMAQDLLSQELQVEEFAVAGVTHTEGTDPATDLSDFLNVLVADGKDFYAVLQEQEDASDQEEVSTWVAANNKLHFIRVSDLPSVYTGTLDDNTFVAYTTQSDEYPAAAAAGAFLPKDPGSVNMNNLQISSITNEVLTGTEKSELETNRYNYVVKKYGVDVMSSSYLQGDLYIDQMRDRDYVKTTMEENIASLLINNDKIPYDDTGIAQVVSTVNKTLNQAFGNGIIASNAGGQALFTVTSQSLSDIPQQDIDDRVLKTIEFSYVESGAIDGAEITGRIVAEL